jgi:hypothetical protein
MKLCLMMIVLFSIQMSLYSSTEKQLRTDRPPRLASRKNSVWKADFLKKKQRLESRFLYEKTAFGKLFFSKKTAFGKLFFRRLESCFFKGPVII